MRLKDFKLERFFAQHELKVPYLLCASDCEPLTIEEILMLEPQAVPKFNTLTLGYTEYAGHPELRHEIAQLYSTGEPDDILVFSGAEEAIFIFMNVALNKGDHIIVQYPAYQSLYGVAEANGLTVTYWVMDEKNSWSLDLDFLQQNIRENTKCLIINSPHNPTGHLMPQETFKAIVEIAQQHDILVFSDEVYRLLEYDTQQRLPAFYDVNEKGLSLGVMSKVFGLAGLRIGWIATKNKDLFMKMASFRDYTTICSSTPSEFLATIALKHKETLLRRNNHIIQENLALIDGFFQKYQDLLEWIRPNAGPIAFPKIVFGSNVEDVCTDLLEKKGVLLLPSTIFEFGTSHFRIGFGRRNLPEALEKFEEYLSEYLSS